LKCFQLGAEITSGPAITNYQTQGVKMSFGFKNIGHFFATVAGDIVKGARAVASVMIKAEKAEPEVEALTALFFPQAVELERGAFALLGLAAQAVTDAGSAAEGNGINVALDAQLVADIKGLIQAIEQYAQPAGITKPVVAAKAVGK
ncbi:MAG TPA: hypothetical protein VGV35_16435, partial [Bryobacteraceae bacterium]|nr:hypothetical protein [Bryobacteraceae bacterium]